MLTITAPDAQIKEAQGQFQDLTWVVESTDLLVNQTIYVVPSFFASNLAADLPGVPSVYFSAIYKPSLATSEMGLTGVGDIWKNGRVLIEYVTAKQFKIHLRFLNVADTRGSLGSTAINNNDRFLRKAYSNVPGFQGIDTVYDVLKYLALQIYTSGGEAVTSNISYRAQPINTQNFTYTFSVGNQQKNGFSAIGNTTFSFLIGEEFVGSEYYAGIYRVDAVQSNDDYIDDLDVQYAKINDSVTQADQFPFNRFVAGTPIVHSGPNALGTFEIDNLYFNPFGTYRFFVVFKVGDQWYSKTSEPFSRDTQEIGPGPVYGDITYQIQTYDSNSLTYPASCVSGISPYERIKVCVSMDKATYLTSAQAEGASGTFDTNYVSIEGYQGLQMPNFKTGGLGADSPLLQAFFPDVTGLDADSAEATACYEFRIPGSWAGSTRYLTFVFTFDMGTHTDYIYVPVVLNVNTENSTFVTNPQFSGDFTDVICSDFEGDVTLDLDLSDLPTGYDIIPMLIKNGKTLEEDLYLNDNLDRITSGIITGDDGASAGTTSLQFVFDAGELDPRAEYCLRLVFKEDISDTSNPDGVDCDCFDFDATQTVLSFNNSTTQLQFEFDAASYLTALSYEVQNWNIIAETVDGEVLASESFTDSSGSFTFEYPTPLFAEVVYKFNVILRNGCTYNAEFTMQSYVDNNVERVYTAEDICDPPDALFFSAGCLNYPTIEATCDDSGDTIALSNGGSILSTPTSDTLYYNTTGEDDAYSEYTTPVVATEIWAKRVVEFSDGCPDVEVYDYFTCEFTEQECSDDIGLETDYDPGAQTLAVSKTGTVVCGFSADNIQYSIDDGVTFTDYSTPLDVTSINEVVFVRTLECSDGCPEVTTELAWDKSNLLNCDYTDFELSTEYDDGLNVHSAVMVGTDSDLMTDNIEYSVDGGVTWSDYTAAVSADVVTFRRTLKYPNCDEEIIVRVSARTCCEISGDHKIYVETVSSGDTVTVDENVADTIAVFRNGVYQTPSRWTRVGNTYTFNDRNFAPGEEIAIIYL